MAVRTSIWGHVDQKGHSQNRASTTEEAERHSDERAEDDGNQQMRVHGVHRF